jgi:hypothetical protein
VAPATTGTGGSAGGSPPGASAADAQALSTLAAQPIRPIDALVILTDRPYAEHNTEVVPAAVLAGTAARNRDLAATFACSRCSSQEYFLVSEQTVAVPGRHFASELPAADRTGVAQPVRQRSVRTHRQTLRRQGVMAVKHAEVTDAEAGEKQHSRKHPTPVRRAAMLTHLEA